MPIPAYVVLSESGATDRHSNQVSIFNVVEVILVREQKPNETPAVGTSRTPAQRIVAVWCREDKDLPEEQFEGQVVCLAPDGTELFQTPVVPFRFTAHFYRIDIASVQMPGFNAVGQHKIESRLRRSGEPEWQWRQSFPFFVQEVPV